MQTQLFVIDAGFDCPFRHEALRFIPPQSYEDGSTLLFFHAMTLHKETFIPLIMHLLKKLPSGKINDIWAIENPNHGRSSRLNQTLLDSYEYREKWSPAEYAKAAYAFLATPSTRVDFRKRKLIAVTHSAGSVALLTLLRMHPEIKFQGVILMDPGLVRPHLPSTTKIVVFFRKLALLKRDTWASFDEARRDLSKGPYRKFVPAAFDSFLEFGLRPLDASGAVTLACSKAQEEGYYASDDIVISPAEILMALSEEDKLPVHLIVCLKDEFRYYNA
ncbi:hypothetical protein H0H92_008008 [Tricholoma furcatifolium]|nr:hypothetical protein H0H92_008008 [Tricholoma furcatifolium]